VYGLIRHGEIPGVRRLGRTLRVHRGAVLAWLAEGQGRAPRPRRQP
jgi:excisionase family DNA binding protein